MVPRQTEGGAAAAEDDGVVLTMVTDARAKCSLLVRHLIFALIVIQGWRSIDQVSCN